jgi:hypothetical protein
MLKTLSKLLAASAVVLLTTSIAARADLLSGTYTTTNMLSYVPLWDLSGEYDSGISNLGTFDIIVTNDPSGKFTGAGSIIIDTTIDKNPVDDILATNVTVSGDVTGSSKKPFVVLKLDYSTSGVIDGYTFKSLTQKFIGAFTLHTNDDTLSGKGVSNFKGVVLDPKTDKYITKYATASVKDASFSLPTASTGDWALVLSLTNSGTTKYTGSASIATSEGNEVDFTVKGTYASKTDKSTLTLKGLEGTDSDLTLVITDSGPTFDSINGKVFGQTLSYKFTEPKD